MQCKTEKEYMSGHTNGEGTQVFTEGDNVICRVKDGRRYMGMIAMICRYQENTDGDSQHVIYLNTSQNKMSYSGEIIKAEDIAYMCRVPVNDLFEYPQTDEALDRDAFINMIVGLGHEREKAETMYESIRELIALYNVPLASILVSVIRELELDMNKRDQNELFKVNNRLMGILVQAFERITKSVKEIVENATVSQDRSSGV